MILSPTYHKETRVGVDHLGLVAGLQVPEDGGVVEESQVDHVLALLEPDHKQRRVGIVVFEWQPSYLGGLTRPMSPAFSVNFSCPIIQQSNIMAVVHPFII